MCMSVHVTDITTFCDYFICVLFVNLPLFTTHFIRCKLRIQYLISFLPIDVL